jgi:hypothetical protein
MVKYYCDGCGVLIKGHNKSFSVRPEIYESNGEDKIYCPVCRGFLRNALVLAMEQMSEQSKKVDACGNAIKSVVVASKKEEKVEKVEKSNDKRRANKKSGR